MGFLLHWAIVAAALWVAAYLIPGVVVHSVPALLVAALVLGLVNALVRPILTILTLPITILTLGLFYLVVNGAAFSLAAAAGAWLRRGRLRQCDARRVCRQPHQLGAGWRPGPQTRMISALFRSLGLAADDGARHETETVSEIATVLTGVPPERARLLAAFAYLLGASPSPTTT